MLSVLMMDIISQQVRFEAYWRFMAVADRGGELARIWAHMFSGAMRCREVVTRSVENDRVTKHVGTDVKRQK